MSAEFDSAAFVTGLVKQRDHDRYLSALVLPKGKRIDILTLFAFAAEIAGVRERISDPATGEIRLQWWHDALENQGHGDVARNPLAAALFEVLSKYSLPRGPLIRLVAARRFDLYDDPMPDLETFEGYAGETSSVLYQYAAMILNSGEPVELGDAAGHLGVAHALIGHMRAFGYHAGQARIMLPWNILAAHNVREADIFSGTASDELIAAFAAFRDLATGHLAKARIALTSISRELRVAFAHEAILKRQFEALERQPEDIFVPSRSIPDWQLIISTGTWVARKVFRGN